MDVVDFDGIDGQFLLLQITEMDDPRCRLDTEYMCVFSIQF